MFRYDRIGQIEKKVLITGLVKWLRSEQIRSLMNFGIYRFIVQNVAGHLH